MRNKYKNIERSNIVEAFEFLEIHCSKDLLEAIKKFGVDTVGTDAFIACALCDFFDWTIEKRKEEEYKI